MSRLSVLSFGGGQDSTTILYKLIYDPKFRLKYAPNDLIVVMSDTGNEHDYTYQHVEYIKKLCQSNQIPFFFLTGTEYHTEAWKSLQHHFEDKSVVLGVGLGSRKSCTTNLKIRPIDRFMKQYISDTYGDQGLIPRERVVQFAEEHGKISVMIGFAAKEERRVNGTKNNHKNIEKWKLKSFDWVYPLVDIGYDRQACQDYIREIGERLPPPSNCKMCYFMSPVELVWMFRNLKDDLFKWADYEQAKLIKNQHLADRNKGVFGSDPMMLHLRKCLDKVVDGKPLRKWTDEELWNYKMSHGHCVMSTY